jgi:hypothetical protein
MYRAKSNKKNWSAYITHWMRVTTHRVLHRGFHKWLKDFIENKAWAQKNKIFTQEMGCWIAQDRDMHMQAKKINTYKVSITSSRRHSKFFNKILPGTRPNARTRPNASAQCGLLVCTWFVICACLCLLPRRTRSLLKKTSLVVFVIL